MIKELNFKTSSVHPLLFNLEKSLSPLWKWTYYIGFTFDWCRRIPNQSRLSIIIRCLVIFFSFVFQVYAISFSIYDLCRVVINPEKKFRDVVLKTIVLGDRPLVLYVWFYFLRYRADIQTFFSDWGRMEEKFTKGFDSATIKRTVIIIYSVYYTYGFLFLFVFVGIFTTSTSPISASDDWIINYYPDLVLNTPYTIFVRLIPPVSITFVTVFFPLIDILPAIVYCHAAKLVEAMRWDVRDLITNVSGNKVSKSDHVYNLWSRFETLTFLVDRADRLFGGIIIICHGILFFCTCTIVYSLLNTIKNPSDDGLNTLPLYLTCLFQYPSRLLFSVCFLSKLNDSSAKLRSAVAYLSHRLERSSDKEERRIMRSFYNRLKETKLAACPSGFYKVKSSVLLTLLSLIVSYTIILLQTNNDGGHTKNILQNNSMNFTN